MAISSPLLLSAHWKLVSFRFYLPVSSQYFWLLHTDLLLLDCMRGSFLHDHFFFSHPIDAILRGQSKITIKVLQGKEILPKSIFLILFFTLFKIFSSQSQTFSRSLPFCMTCFKNIWGNIWGINKTRKSSIFLLQYP